MKIAIFGGSFNPPHNGHIDAARAVYETLNPDKLIFIPSFCPPHKPLAESSPPPEERLLLTELAARELPGAIVSDIELRRGDVSYTADTLADLSAQYPGAELILLMGADMFFGFTDWYNFGEIIKLCTLAPFPRKDGELPLIENFAEKLLAEYGAKARVIQKKPLEISSTSLREALKIGEGREYLPESVYARIIQKRLYGAAPELAWLRVKAAELLKPSRVAHVLGTEQEAVSLAKRWGADTQSAAEAAILHDITKKLSQDEQLILCEKYGIISGGSDAPSPKLYHAKTGAMLAAEEFGVSDEVRGAIEWHTTGRENMTLLEKIIYIADYIEPGREFDGVDILRRLAYENLDEAMLLGLKMSIGEITARGDTPCGSSQRAYDSLLAEKELKHEEKQKKFR